MTTSPIVVRTELTRLLAGLPAIRQLDEILRIGRLPVDDRNRAIIEKGLLSIKHEYAQRDAVRQQPNLAKAFADISQALGTFLQVAFQDGAGQRAVAIMEEGAVWRPSIEITSYFTVFIALCETSMCYSQLYDQKIYKNTRATTLENWLFYRFYQLFEEIKDARPGIAKPLYRFTMTSLQLLDIKVRNITEDAFRMRVQRLARQARSGIAEDAELRTRVLQLLNER